MRGLTEPVLPDILRPGLRIVFCGSAAGTVSAQKGAYYAHPQNKFWNTLHAVGLTDRLLKPEEFPILPDYGIGLTDMAKNVFGADASLPRSADDPAGLHQRISLHRPLIVAFNGKRAAQVFFRHQFDSRQVDYGPANQTVGDTAIFILPSTSPLAVRYWDEGPWYALAHHAKTV